MNVTVVRSGFLTTVQDLGRNGFRQYGVAAGGALDSRAMRIANLLVGNDEGAAGVELTQGNVALRFADSRTIAWCGGDYEVRVASAGIPAGHAAFVAAGEELAISGPSAGGRCWLAISGGIDVPVVLGSRATNLQARFGGLEGRELRDGDILPLGEALLAAGAIGDQRISSWSASHDWSHAKKTEPVLRYIRGADWERFNGAMIRRFTSEAFTVSADSNRMGIRLEGPKLEREDEDVDLVSEPVAPGTIQVPPDGNPIVLLGDCQTIGGYPKIAHVISVDLSIAAQLRAEDRVRFREISLADAHRLLAERELDLDQFRIGLALQRS